MAIKIDVEYVLDETLKANNALEELKENITRLQSSYEEILDSQKSDEFVKEFKESIGELVEKANELSNEAIGQIINGLEVVAQEYQAVDDASASAMGVD